MMEMRTKLRCGIVRRKCSQISKTSIKIARKESLKKVSTILRKNESSRSAEEKAVLAKMTEEVREVKYRLFRKQKIIERNKEVEDDISVLKVKCKKLAIALQRAKHLVVYTGAGISTAADIPDYRGPNGIWTLLQQGKTIGKYDLTKADPTSTHMALWQLYKKKYLKFVVSQNCDGLHLRSGLPRKALSEVHGNMYIEMCKECKPNIQYWRLFDTTERTARFYHKTGRICHYCGTPLVDSIVHFGERGIAQWPLNWAGALHHAAKADVILCLGSSLKVLKKYPWLWAMDKPVKKRPAIFIVNLQWTPKDHVAELKINGRCDSVMKLVMEYIGLETPDYDRNLDPIFAHSSLLSPKELHTTTQPILVKIIKNDNEINLENKLLEINEENKECPKDKNMDIDEDEENCSLKVLKDKLVINSENICDAIQDLTIPKIKQEHHPQTEQFDMQLTKEIKNQSHSDCKENIHKVHNVHQEDTKKDIVMDSSVKMSCVWDVNEKTELISEIKNNNLKINAVISSSMKSELDCSDEDTIHKGVEGISMEILAEEFERVHIEMKTNENEFSKVSILLVNKSKTPPKKCDKALQTEPEQLDVFQINNSNFKNDAADVPLNLKLLDTGQPLNSLTDIVKEETINDQSHVTVESSKIIKSHLITPAQIDNNINKNLTLDSQNILNLSCKSQAVNVNKPLNPLRNFRKIKQVQKVLFKEESICINGDAKDCNIFMSHEENKTIICDFEEPVDYSLKLDKSEKMQLKIPHFFPERKPSSTYILKIPIPQTFHINKKSDINSTNGVVDLSMSKMRENNLYYSKRPASGITNLLNLNYQQEIHDDFENFKLQCEILAKAIIQNTLQSNHNELQKAYSGIHSIINPIEFNVQYDFQAVFNALNFINFGQKLISKDRVNVVGVRRSSRTSNKSDENKSSSSVTSNATSKRKCRNKTRFTKKKQPSCEFCYKKYNSITCCFYVPHNSDDRFIRYESNKPYMCICCGDSESSSESDDDLSLMERKRRLESKVSDESEDGKTINDCKSDNDLKSVQNADKEENCENKDGNVQAGWFGKGFRKNRRRKR